MQRISAVLVFCVGLAAVRVDDKVPFAARPFPLQQVRLLDGPFKQARQLDEQYLLSLDLDRLLHNFRVNAGLPSAAKPLGGWEAPDVELRGHSVGHYLSALALMYASTGDPRFKDRADSMVAELGRVQDALAKRFHPGYLSAFPEEFFDRVESRQKVWAPYYTIHKILAGLLDVAELCGNEQALGMASRMADWAAYRVDHLSDDQQQRALDTEHGGMNEALANLYAATGNRDYLRVAHKFDHRAIFDPLSRREDPLDGLHANTQFPKIIGAAREYELTGDTKYRDLATFFWDRVVHHRSFVTGGNSDNESFFPEVQFSKHLGPSSAETCNTYNMLKLTRHIFGWSGSAEAMDFYERGLFNHILPSQDPETGMVIYYCPLRPGAWKSYSTPDDSFWCCVGTGMENHAKYGDTIYFHDEQNAAVYVNLFIPSQLKWVERGVTLRQETRFPIEDTTHLTIDGDAPARFAIKVRYPGWARAITVSVNGEPQRVAGEPGSYVNIERTWKRGDRVDIRVPMTTRIEAMPDDPHVVAVLDGPIVLAGDLGREGLDDVKRYGPSAPQVGRVKTPVVPAFVGSAKDVLEKLVPNGAPLHFRTAGLGQPHDVSLRPFYEIVDQRYTVYWSLYSSDEWRARKSEIAAGEARRRSIAERTIDVVTVDDASSEQAHGSKSENSTDGYFEGRRTREARDGWFSYALAVAADRSDAIVATYRGGEGAAPHLRCVRRRHQDRDGVTGVSPDGSARQGVRAARRSRSGKEAGDGEVPGAAAGNRRTADRIADGDAVKVRFARSISAAQMRTARCRRRRRCTDGRRART
jgi:DUF1680 family protein